jgi:hypothetical protein
MPTETQEMLSAQGQPVRHLFYQRGWQTDQAPTCFAREYRGEEPGCLRMLSVLLLMQFLAAIALAFRIALGEEEDRKEECENRFHRWLDHALVEVLCKIIKKSWSSMDGHHSTNLNSIIYK